jgi:hypothetical protein
MPPTHVIAPEVNEQFNRAYTEMDLLSTALQYESYRNRASAIAVLIDALHHDYANHMQMEVDGS